jgi:plasmid stabilization system protein ParE
MPYPIISSQAQADLDSIVEYIAEDNPDAAWALLRQFLEPFDRLGEFPNSVASALGWQTGCGALP